MSLRMITAILRLIVLESVGEWLIIFSLIFGGCCSNALTLELITSQFAPAGSLITFAQFLLVSLVGLRNQVVVIPQCISKDALFERISRELLEMHRLHSANSIHIGICYSDSTSSRSFAKDLALFIQRTSRNTLDSAKLVSSHEDHIHAADSSQSLRRDSVVKNDNAIHVFMLPLTCYSQQPKWDILVVIEHDLWRVYNNDQTASIIVDVSQPNKLAFIDKRRRRIALNPFQLRLKPRRIPFTRYAIQVLLFLLISLLNNVVFGYNVPMTVHIIFRSGGLVVNMLLGWIIENRRYTTRQVLSVLLVTSGVTLTTLSAAQSKSRHSLQDQVSIERMQSNSSSYWTYAIGIAIMSLALILSGFLGLSQDQTFKRYGRGNWEEAMFYLHALSIPLFIFVRADLTAQIHAANASPGLRIGISSLQPLPYLPIRPPSFIIPSFYLPLLLNVLTQTLCASGVNRLTSRVNSLTVTLVLVVRKAVSLAISVLLVGGSEGNTWLWLGAAAVLIGTVIFAVENGESLKKKE